MSLHKYDLHGIIQDIQHTHACDSWRELVGAVCMLLPCVLWWAAELAEHEEQQVGVSQLGKALERAREEMVKEEREAEETTVQARVSKEELLAAEREYECLIQWSTSDPEFVRLQAELGQHRQGGPEDVCRQLRRELEAVQEEYYAHQWKKTKEGGGPCHWSGHRDPSQMHRHGVQQQGASGRNTNISPSSSPVDDTLDLAGEGTASTQGSPAPLTDKGSTLYARPDMLGGVGTSGRMLLPQQQAIRAHQSSHSTRASKTGPFGGWKRQSRAVLQKEFTSPAGHV